MKLFSKSTVSSGSGVAACKYLYHKFKKKTKFRNHSTESYLNILILTFITCPSESFTLIIKFPVPAVEAVRSDWTKTVNRLNASWVSGRFHCGLLLSFVSLCFFHPAFWLQASVCFYFLSLCAQSPAAVYIRGFIRTLLMCTVSRHEAFFFLFFIIGRKQCDDDDEDVWFLFCFLGGKCWIWFRIIYRK